MTPPTDIYAWGLAGSPLEALVGGARVTLPVSRWLGEADASDHAALRWAQGPVLDVGCGPGRHLAALSAAGIAALGIDPSPAAVAAARARGVGVVRASVFGPVPAAGRWGTALLLDGNVGIGGRPIRLLRRLGELVAPGGGVIVELGPPGTGLRRLRVRLACAETCSAPFPWALVGAEAIEAIAEQAGMHVAARRAAGGRWFALVR